MKHIETTPSVGGGQHQVLSTDASLSPGDISSERDRVRQTFRALIHKYNKTDYLLCDPQVNAEFGQPHFIDASTGNPAFPVPAGILAGARASSVLEDSRSYNLSTMHGHDKDDRLFREKIAKYLKWRGLLASDINLPLPSELGEDGPTSTQLDVIIANGLTEIYDAIIQAVLQSPGDVVIMPSPTYGLFVAQVEKEPLYGRVAYVALDTNYKVTSEALAQVCQLETQKLTSTYKVQVNLAVSFILTFSQSFKTDNSLIELLLNELNNEIDRIAAYPQSANYDIMDAIHAKLMAEIDRTIRLAPRLQGTDIDIDDLIKNHFKFRLCPRVRAFFNMNPHNPYGVVYSQADINSFAEVIAPYQDMCVIDDYAHAEVRMGKVGLFNRVLSDRTFSLYGFSKNFGLAAYRVGLCVAPQDILVNVCENISQSAVTVNYAGKMLVIAVPKNTAQHY